MKIGLIIYGSLDTVSGGYLYDRRLVHHLRDRGDTVQLISLPWRSWPRHLLQNLSPWLWRQLLDADLDALLQDELNHPSLILPNLPWRPWPVLSIVHHLRSSEPDHPAPLRPLYAAVERAYLDTVDGFIFNSATTREAVAALSPRPRPDVVAHPGGDRLGAPLDPLDIAARAAEPGPLRLLFIGNLTPRKGLHTLLRALDRLPGDLCRLDVVGSTTADPDYVRQLTPLLTRLGDRVTLHGALSDDRLKALLTTRQLLVVPSSYEGFGIVYMEAAAFGLPAIATTSGAAAEIITPSRTGYLIPPDDDAALTRHLTHLAHRRDRLTQMGVTAFARFERHPTWTQTAEAIRGFVHEQARRWRVEGLRRSPRSPSARRER